MTVDANRMVDSVAKLGPGHFLAVLALLMVCGAGYIINEGLNEVHVDLVELRHAVDRQAGDAADARADFKASQERQERLLVAVCFAAANGLEAERRRCEDATR